MSTVAVRPQTLADVAMPRAGMLQNVLLVVAASLLTAAAAQAEIRLPWTPVPITGQTFMVLLSGAVLGARRPPSPCRCACSGRVRPAGVSAARPAFSSWSAPRAAT
jgi:hypothetical protein